MENFVQKAQSTWSKPIRINAPRTSYSSDKPRPNVLVSISNIDDTPAKPENYRPSSPPLDIYNPRTFFDSGTQLSADHQAECLFEFQAQVAEAEHIQQISEDLEHRRIRDLQSQTVRPAYNRNKIARQAHASTINLFSNPSPLMNRFIDEFAQIQRTGYNDNFVQVINLDGNQENEPIARENILISARCENCHLVAADPRFCIGCGSLFCNPCLRQAISFHSSCVAPDGTGHGSSGHGISLLSEEMFQERFGRLHLICEYGCEDTDPNIPNFSEMDQHNCLLNKCPNRRCKSCNLWKICAGENSPCPSHLAMFHGYLDYQIKLLNDKLKIAKARKVERVFPRESERLIRNLENLRNKLQKDNDQMEFSLRNARERNNILVAKNKELQEEITKRKDLEKELEKMNELIRSKDKAYQQALSTIKTLCETNQSTSYSSQTHILETSDNLFEINMDPTDDSPFTTQRFNQVTHPNLPTKIFDDQDLPKDMTIDEAYDVILNKFGLRDSDPHLNLVSFKMRVESDGRRLIKNTDTIQNRIRPTQFLSLLPSDKVKHKTTYRVKVPSLEAVHNPTLFAIDLGIWKRPSPPDRKNKKKKKAEKDVTMAEVDVLDPVISIRPNVPSATYTPTSAQTPFVPNIQADDSDFPFSSQFFTPEMLGSSSFSQYRSPTPETPTEHYDRFASERDGQNIHERREGNRKNRRKRYRHKK